MYRKAFRVFSSVLISILAFSGALLAARLGGSAVAAPRQAGVAASTTVYLPFVTWADPYANWVALGQPAGSNAVNFVYVSQDCVGTMPKTILAGTDAGLYSYSGGWVLNDILGPNIEVAHILNTSQGGMFLASYNIGIWHSADGGATWAQESLPGSDALTRWLAANDQYVYVAGQKGMYRRSLAGGAWSKIRDTATYVVAASGSMVYAAEIGPQNGKDTLYISADGGNTWPISRQLPGAVDLFQTLDSAGSGLQLLIGAVDGGLFTLDGANNVVPFSQGTHQTVYGIWRDAQGRVYAALDSPGGLKRFPQAGGASDLDLSALPGGGSLTSQTLYSIDGSTACKLIAVGALSGNVWARRVP